MGRFHGEGGESILGRRDSMIKAKDREERKAQIYVQQGAGR